MAQFPYVIPIANAQFVGTLDTNGPHTWGKIFIDAVPVADYNISGVDAEFSTIVAFQEVAVHIHQNDLVLLYDIRNPLNPGQQINNFGGWHVIARW